MFITPYFGGCKYTNKFLFINKNTEFQCFELLITFGTRPSGLLLYSAASLVTVSQVFGLVCD